MFGSYLPGAFDSSRGRQMMKQFRRQLAPVADIFCGETLGSIAEVTAFLDVFGDVAAELWVSVTLEDADSDPENPRLRSGESLLDLLHAVERHRHDALLFNCSQPEVMADAIRLARWTLDRFARQHGKAEPLIGVYANAFPLMDEDYQGSNTSVHKLRADITPENYTRYAREWAALGADIIGGCCGISPDHIAHLATTLRGDLG
jgi:S-methylmethionine-dependent homocysteine/selenocysteine methylase